MSMSLRTQRARAAMRVPRISLAMRCDGLEITLRGDGKAGLDDVHAEALKLVGHSQLFVGVHAAAGRLFAVAQGGVEDQDLFGWGSYVECPCTLPSSVLEALVKLLFFPHA